MIENLQAYFVKFLKYVALALLYCMVMAMIVGVINLYAGPEVATYAFLAVSIIPAILLVCYRERNNWLEIKRLWDELWQNIFGKPQ